MLANDLEPNRLARAKEAMQRLLVRLRGNRIGIIAFAGDAYLLCPMTEDAALARLVLQSIDAKTVGVQGTDLGRVIEVAQGAFERGGNGSHVLVLITDGEDNEARGLETARKAAEDLRIFAVGIGTERGAPIPEGRQGYKEDRGGTKVVSHLDMETLTAIARATGGTAYVVGDNPASAVNVVAGEIDNLEKVMRESQTFVTYQDRFGWFVLPAMGLLLVFLLMRPRPTTSPRPSLETAPAASGRSDA
jgi:Ca-activated chloride channel family protein